MNGLLEDDGKTGAWDMGNGTGREAQRTVHAQALAGQETPDKDFVPPPSVYRHTTTPQPAATHGGGAAVALLEPMEKLSKEFPAEFDENFPSDMKQCLQILKAVDALPIYLAGEDEHAISKGSRRRRDEQMRRRKLIGAHILKLQNGEPAPYIGAHEIAEMQAAQRNRPAARAARIQLLKATCMMLGELIHPLPEPDQLGLTDAPDEATAKGLLSADPKDRLTLHPDVRNLLNKARVQAMGAELFALENYDLCHPTEHCQELEYEFRNCKDPERIRALRLEIAAVKENGGNLSASSLTNLDPAALRDIGGKNALTAISMKGQSESKWLSAFKTLELLKSVSGKIVAGWGLDAAELEHDFFAQFGLPAERTSLSRRYRALLDEINKLSVSKTTFAWFGIQDIAEL